MSDSEEEPKKKKGGIFGRKRLKKKESTGDNSRGGSSRGGSSFGRDSSVDGDSTVNSDQERRKKKKKKGIGRRIKRIVVGRKKAKKDDEASAVEFLDKNDPNYRGPRTALDPDILKKVMEVDGDELPIGGRYGVDGRSIDEPINEEDEEDEDMDIMSYGEVEKGSGQDEPGDLMFPVGLVLLLVDPDTLRFELLQLDFETPQDAKVADVLEQVKDSITEPAIRALEFHALLDRKGGQFTSSTALAKALTNRKRSKDILVALSKGVNADKCSRLARPILGDPKVITMLETNGYNVKGWAKNKQEESELPDAKPDTFAIRERKRQLRSTMILLGGLLVAYCFYRLFHYFFDPAVPIVPMEEALENSTSLLNTTETILEAEELAADETMVDAHPEVA